MKRVLIAACLLIATAGSAAAQQAMTQLHNDALPGQPQRFSFEAGSAIVLDAGAPVAADHDNLTLSHVPPGSAWIVELPAIVTVEGTQRVRVSCAVNEYALSLQSSAGGMTGATEHTFETGGPFLGRIVLGIPRIVAPSMNAEVLQCALVVFGTRNGIDWRAFENTAISDLAIGSPAQYVLEADNSRLLSGVSFRRQVVLSAHGYVLTEDRQQ